MHEILSVVSQKNHRNCCQEMSHFKAKMRQIRFRLGLRPRPRCGSLQHSPNPLAGFKGPTSKGRGGKRERVGRKGEGKGEDGRGRVGDHTYRKKHK